ncbi:acetoin utilization protein AcuC [Kroppenstedtia guangzhouensis]|uniref:Acetoin utilization protein AcuC n=1 Tax=Kroppenstedtia guangzhouensis TaxID=1274356 RepID=A0ABQ1GSI5_9BACL|nr:acetoin utilization protein AcuC [Kroppenstedtia guangzhouensis]GGA49477.1 acetoin utilization protein AcuC [Kroppenstedtia guangzhouensis]
MKDEARFIYSEDLLRYRFGDNHPFDNRRLKPTLDLIRTLGRLEDHHLHPPRPATEEELILVHDPDYICLVKEADRGDIPRERLEEYGLGTEDNPVFPGIHQTSALVTGGTLEAAEIVMSGQARHALNLSGGLHHALRGKASGFCIYNDAAVAIAQIRKKYQARVLYIDTDAHHGDGVQWAFYHDPEVLTLSIHETGRYLFPGTGNVYERGHDTGLGSCINVPLDAFTEDESWLDAFQRVIPRIARSFQPDVILSQNGCDAHRYDPLTHLSATMRIYRIIPQVVHELAHELCDGRWIAVGGGGYDIWRVVPRAWTYLWAEMSGRPLNEMEIPRSWLEKWQPKSPLTLPDTLHDPEGLFEPIPRREEITQKNERTVNQVLKMAGLLK